MMDEENTKPGAMSAEQAADLAAIQASAAGEAVQPGQEVATQGPPPPSAQAMGAAGLFVGIAMPILCATVRGLREAPQELWEPVTEGVAGLLDHYGLASEALNGPWARFAFSVAPLAGFVVIAQMKAEADKPRTEAQTLTGPDLTAKAPAGPVGANTVTFGAPAA